MGTVKRSPATTFIAGSLARRSETTLEISPCLCASVVKNGYATLRPTAGAIMRNSSMSLAN